MTEKKKSGLDTVIQLGMHLGIVIVAAYNVGPTAGLVAVICCVLFVLTFLAFIAKHRYEDYCRAKNLEAWLKEEKRKHPEFYGEVKKKSEKEKKEEKEKAERLEVWLKGRRIKYPQLYKKLEEKEYPPNWLRP